MKLNNFQLLILTVIAIAGMAWFTYLMCAHEYEAVYTKDGQLGIMVSK